MFQSITRRALVLGFAVAAIGPFVCADADAQVQEPVLGISFGPVSLDRKAGTIAVTFTVTCDEPVTGGANVFVAQPVGRVHGVQGGSNEYAFACSPESPATITALVTPNDGKFGNGTAYISVNVFAFDASGNNGNAQSTEVVTLGGS